MFPTSGTRCSAFVRALCQGAWPDSGQGSDRSFVPLLIPARGRRSRICSRILFGKGWRTDCPNKDLAGARGRLRAGEGARLGASSFFFNRGMTQAPVISLLIGSNQFLQELPLINVGLLRSHSLGSQRRCLLLPPRKCSRSRLLPRFPALSCSEVFFFLSTFWGSGEIHPSRSIRSKDEMCFISWVSVFSSSFKFPSELWLSLNFVLIR